MREIIFTIGKDGELTAFKGFQGKECYKEAQRLIRALAEAGLEVSIEEIIPQETEAEMADQTLREKEWEKS